MGRKAKSLTGGTKASHNALIMTVGFFGGTISDVLLYSLKFPGYDSKIATCDALTLGDIGELLFFGFLTWIGTISNSLYSSITRCIKIRCIRSRQSNRSYHTWIQCYRESRSDRSVL